MTAEIILPIKCSTVKKVSSMLESVIIVELGIVLIEWVIFSIWGFWMWGNYPNHAVTQTIDQGLCVFGLFAGLSMGGFVAVGIYEMLPSLGCIKDDKEDKRS